MKLSIVIPVYNEESTLSEITQKVLNADKCGLDFEIIFIDDSSIDKTPEITKKISEENKNIEVLRHSNNLGKGLFTKWFQSSNW